MERAAEAGVVRLESCVASRSRGARAVCPFQKRTWTEIEVSEAARVFLSRLGLGAGNETKGERGERNERQRSLAPETKRRQSLAPRGHESSAGEGS